MIDGEQGTSNIQLATVISSMQTTRQVHANVSVDMILINDDKVRLYLMECLSIMEIRRKWAAPFGIILTIVLTLLTTDFRQFYLGAQTWEGLFIALAVVCTVWLVVSLVRMQRSLTVEGVIQRIKLSSQRMIEESNPE